MNKIKQLLLKCDLSEEAATKICESLDSRDKQMRAKFDEEFQARLTKAKEVCLAETEAYKNELARRVQIFLETKNVSIENLMKQQASARTSDAVAKLEKVHKVVEDIELDGQSTSELREENAKLKKVAAWLKEGRNKAVTKGNRLQSITEKSLARNRELEKAVLVLESGGRRPAGKGKGQRRLDEDRNSGIPRTRRPMTEAVISRAVPGRAAGPDRIENRRQDFTTPEGIAEAVDEQV